MPSIAQIEAFNAFSALSPCLKKRKRVQWPFGDSEQPTKLIGMQYTSALADFPTMNNTNSISTSRSTTTSMASPTNQQNLELPPRVMKIPKGHEIKRQRTAVPGSQQQVGDELLSNFQFFTIPYKSHSEKPADPELSMDLSPTSGQNKIDLSPCHICHQKPKVKKDLDSYGYCTECERRTCYVCMRTCLGPYFESVSDFCSEGYKREAVGVPSTNQGVLEGDGQGDTSDAGRNMTPAEMEEHEKMYLHMAERAGEGMMERYEHRERICSHCCMERGTDGDVWCLGCLRVEEAHLQSSK